MNHGRSGTAISYDKFVSACWSAPAVFAVSKGGARREIDRSVFVPAVGRVRNIVWESERRYPPWLRYCVRAVIRSASLRGFRNAPIFNDRVVDALLAADAAEDLMSVPCPFDPSGLDDVMAETAAQKKFRRPYARAIAAAKVSVAQRPKGLLT